MTKNQTQVNNKLFANSWWYCWNPDCNIELFEDKYEVFHIWEKAHINAKSDWGPRANKNLSILEREFFENKILLCANCHTKIDKNPQKYNLEVIRQWKTEHWRKIEQTFSKKWRRSDLRKSLSVIFHENNLIFETYWPNSKFSKDPSDHSSPNIWKQKIIEIIIPNNKKILKIIEENHSILEENEYPSYVKLKQHINEFKKHHIESNQIHVITFPKDALTLFKD